MCCDVTVLHVPLPEDVHTDVSGDGIHAVLNIVREVLIVWVMHPIVTSYTHEQTICCGPH